MNTLLRFFWFFCGAWVLAGYGILVWGTGMWWPQESAGRQACRRLLCRATCFIVVVCMVLGVISLLTNTPSVTCTRFLAFERANDIGATLTVLAGWAVVLWWAWRWGGADQIAEGVTALAASMGSRWRVSGRGAALALTAMLVGLLALQVLWPPLEPPDPLCLP